MKYSVNYSRAAIKDIERVRSDVYEASLSPDITIQYIDDLIDKIEDKSEFPESGSPLYYQDRFTGYYFIVFKAYIAFYRIEEGSVLVDRVLLGKSDYMRKLFPHRMHK